MQIHRLDVDLGIVSKRLPDKVKGREQEGARQNRSKLSYLERNSTRLQKFVGNYLFVHFILTDFTDNVQY